MAFELWSGASGNLLSAHNTEAEALAAVRRLAATNDREYIEALGLLRDNGGRTRLIAEGEALLRRAREAAPPESADEPRAASA